MKILSLFDGMGSGAVAARRANLKVSKYMASEIDADAIKVACHNNSVIKQLGDVSKLQVKSAPDLLLGGSPCQGFSYAGKRLNFKDKRSALFFEFVRLFKELKPPYFLLENVPMKKEFQDIISDYMGVEPIRINSSLVSAQNRSRLYWTNIKFELPQDKNITIADILEDTKLPNPGTVNRNLYKGDLVMCLRVKKDPRKSYCLTTCPAAVQTDMAPGLYPNPTREKYEWRPYTLKELCRLQTVPDNYFDGITTKTKATKMLGNGWTIDVIASILKGIN